MKKTLTLIMFCLATAASVQAQDEIEWLTADSTEIPSLEEIIRIESDLSSTKENESHYRKIWGKTTFLNLNYTTTTFSSDAFPTAGGTYQREFKNNLGLGLLSGKTYNFHKKPIGTVLFIGLDFVPMDLNFNSFDEEAPSQQFEQATDEPYCLPWHQKKMTVDYGMSLGPSLTFYPFTALHSSGTDNIRLQFYFRVGYHFAVAMIDEVSPRKGKDKKTEYLWGNGLSKSYGLNLTWGFVGFGYEHRQFSTFTYRPFSSTFKTGDLETEQANNRLYLQFRF